MTLELGGLGKANHRPLSRYESERSGPNAPYFVPTFRQERSFGHCMALAARPMNSNNRQTWRRAILPVLWLGCCVFLIGDRVSLFADRVFLIGWLVFYDADHVFSFGGLAFSFGHQVILTATQAFIQAYRVIL